MRFAQGAPNAAQPGQAGPTRPMPNAPRGGGMPAGSLSPRGAVTGGGRPAPAGGGMPAGSLSPRGAVTGGGRPAMKKGGKVAAASSRADGIAKKGKTKGRMV